MSLPTSTELGLPEKFARWRRHQEDAVLDMVASDHRFIGLVAPTGLGKTYAYHAYAKLIGADRICVLTSTKSLQDQLLHDFNNLDIRGKANYLCVHENVPEGITVDDAPCQAGFECEYRDWWKGNELIAAGSGCPYYDLMRKAKTAEIVVTNYSYWLAINKYGRGIGKFDLLILDEAHAAPDELAAFLSFSIHEGDIRHFGLRLPTENEHDWWQWASTALNRMEPHLIAPRSQNPDDIRQFRKWKRIAGGLASLISLGQRAWTAELTNRGRTMMWDITNPAPYAEDFLFRGIGKVVLSSATVRQRTLDYLGIEPEESVMLEYPSSFPPARRPIYGIADAPRLNYRSGEGDRQVWLELIDSFIDSRQDRRGIIHSVSFQRARDIMDGSRHSQLMVGHEPGVGLKKGVEEYLSRDNGILVSPSVTTGVDFPYKQCEYVIVGKVPYPDMRSKVLKARMKIDPDYPAYIAAQTMVQATGRGMRAEDDQCESVIVDGALGWFLGRYAAFTPRWWRKGIQKVYAGKMDGSIVMPKPLKKL